MTRSASTGLPAVDGDFTIKPPTPTYEPRPGVSELHMHERHVLLTVAIVVGLILSMLLFLWLSVRPVDEPILAPQPKPWPARDGGQ